MWADGSGRASVWRRIPPRLELVREEARYRPWVLLSSLSDLKYLGARLQPEAAASAPGTLTYRELEGSGELRFLVSAESSRSLSGAVLAGAGRRRPNLRSLRDLPGEELLCLAHEEQYLIASGRNYFRELRFDDLRRLAFDLETTGLDPERNRIFLVALRYPDGHTALIEAPEPSAEAELIRRLMQAVDAADPDVIENHNLHGFDLPFLAQRARRLGVALRLGRAGPGLLTRPAARGVPSAIEPSGATPERVRRTRFTVVGRELLDSMDAVLRYDFAARSLPGHGLKAVARHFGLASDTREHIRGDRVHDVYRSDPERVRRYAEADVVEASGLGRVLGGAAFALARMAPRRYERLADAGPATGVLDPLLIRAYVRSGTALPAHASGDGTPHQGAALYLFATGVAQRIVKADVASLYPSLMREYRIGPERDRLGVLLTLVERLLGLRLEAKARARDESVPATDRHLDEALSAAMKLVINSAYGYMGAVGLTRFADVHAANEVTRRGRELLDVLCDALARRGGTLLEADTDGVYFAVPEHWDEAAERRTVAEVAALLPAGVQLEFEGRYAAMLSHEPKNYALLPYRGALLLRGVAFRSRRAEPFGEAFLRQALEHLLRGDVPGVRAAYVESAAALRGRLFGTHDVSIEVRLTKTAEEYASTREQRRELPYEALLASGRNGWGTGERIRVYRARGGRAALLSPGAGQDSRETRGRDAATAHGSEGDVRDYDVEYYVRLLRTTFAARLARAFEPEVFAQVFADPQQLGLFTASLAHARPVLTVLRDPRRGS